MTTIEKIKQEFEVLKGQFVITEGAQHNIERLVAIGQDQHDYYYVTYNGRKLTWNTCVGRIMPLKGYLRDKDYNLLIDSARLNHFDQETCWGEQGAKSQEHRNNLMKVNENDILLTEICWDLQKIEIEPTDKIDNLLADVQSALLRGLQRKVNKTKDDAELGKAVREIFNDPE